MRIIMKNGRPAVRTRVWVRGEWSEVIVYLDTPRPTRKPGANVLDKFTRTGGRRGGFARIKP